MVVSEQVLRHVLHNAYQRGISSAYFFILSRTTMHIIFFHRTSKYLPNHTQFLFHNDEAHLKINQVSWSWKLDLYLCGRNCLFSRSTINNHKSDVYRKDNEMEKVHLRLQMKCLHIYSSWRVYLPSGIGRRIILKTSSERL